VLDVKICVPIAGAGLDEIQNEAALAFKEGADIIEFRADYYRSGLRPSALLPTIKDISGLPVIFTLRRFDEGGVIQLPQDERQSIMRVAIDTALIDYIDIEAANGSEFVTPLVTAARSRGIQTIISNHDFKHTPTKAAIIETLKRSAALGADIVKAAVMPNSHRDVLTLLDAALEYSETKGSLPLIAISMGDMGRISRCAAGRFGSFMTFASVAASTAPGQIHISDLKKVMAFL